MQGSPTLLRQMQPFLRSHCLVKRGESLDGAAAS